MSESKLTPTPPRRRDDRSGGPSLRSRPRREAGRETGRESGIVTARPPAEAARGALASPKVWALSALGLIALAIAVFVYLFQWNWLRGPIDAWASAQLQRRFVIHGDLNVHPWSWTPSASVNDVTVGEPGWAGPGDMVVIPKLTLAVDLKALLLRGRFAMPLVAAERPSVTLIRDASGRNNWSFGLAGKLAPSQPLKLPPIGRFTIDDGRIAFRDAARKLAFDGVVSSNERIAAYGRGHFTIDGRGSIGGAPFTAQVLGGTLFAYDPDRPYPFTAKIASGPTRVTAEGDIARPFDLSVARATTHIAGPDMEEIYDLTGVTLPNSPPYDLSGDISRNGSRFDIANIRGRIGTSDLSGHLRVQENHGRRDLTGDLVSRRLALADLTAMVGGAPQTTIKGTIASPKQKAAAAQLSAEHRICRTRASTWRGCARWTPTCATAPRRCRPARCRCARSRCTPSSTTAS